MIKAVAIDDEPLALNVIKAYCTKVDFIDLVASFTETAPALDYLKNNKVDLLFLDIQMPAMSGIDLYKLVGPDVMAIFTTAYSEYAVEGFNLSAIDYLLKPIHFDRFQKAVDKARDYYQFQQGKAAGGTDHFFVRADYTTTKVLLADVLYIEGLDNYLRIHLRNTRPIVARISLRSLLEKLPEEQFLRVHRSYIVALDKVTALRNKVIFIGDAEIPVGPNYMDGLQKLGG
jgi:DNA-binding LytR/AlgR family response regulator